MVGVVMSTSLGQDRCLTFINCQLNPKTTPSLGQRQGKLAITLSRQTGAGAWRVAEHLAEFLDHHAPVEGLPWTVFDKSLIEKVLQDNNLPAKLAQFLPEDRISALENIMQELLGLHPPHTTLLQQVTETILKLAELGNVILIGRGANVITAGLPRMFHVRLVGSMEKRVARVQARYHLEPKAAAEFIERADRGRQRYLKEHYGADIADPLLYDLVINTDRIDCDAAAVLIGETALSLLRENPGL
jgi:cytidylate kinase